MNTCVASGLAALLLLASLVDIGLTSATSCDRFSYLATELTICLSPHYIDAWPIPNPMPGTISGPEVLNRLSHTCRNETLRRNIYECSMSATEQCPEKEQYARQKIKTQYEIFCNGDQVSEWLRRVLSGNFEVQSRCIQDAFEVTRRCGKDANDKLIQPLGGLANMTFDMANGIFPILVSSVFHCSIANISKLPVDDCATSWQDVAILNWLVLIRISPIIELPKDCLSELKELKPVDRNENEPFGMFAGYWI